MLMSLCLRAIYNCCTTLLCLANRVAVFFNPDLNLSGNSSFINPYLNLSANSTLPPQFNHSCVEQVAEMRDPDYSDRACPLEMQEFRTIDGRCNNIRNPDWGRSFESPKRLLTNAYDDGRNTPRTLAASGSLLPSCRRISHKLCVDKPSLAKELNVLHMAFGQYIDHDITGFPVTKIQRTEEEGGPVKCCQIDETSEFWHKNGGPCFPIKIPDNDGFFNKTCMEFMRSLPVTNNASEIIEPREQINSITSFVDASTVYGSSVSDLEKLLLADGKLNVTQRPNGIFLPPSNKANCKIMPDSNDYCMLAGDGRVNVFIGLGALHTVFHREHNRVVGELRRHTNNAWDSEKYFQVARKIVAAEHQVITYKEYLPSFLPAQTMEEFKLSVPSTNYMYNRTLNPQMSNAFSTAAFRYGHSQIQRTVRVGNDIRVDMEDTLMRPHLLLEHGVANVTIGMTAAFAENVDRLFVSAVTDRLFENNGTKKDGLDLVALNCQRGRDHGLPSLNDYREKVCGLPRIFSFDDPVLTGGDTLRSLYDSVDDIDLFIGGMAERRSHLGMVGPTFACILGRQFRDLKYGDRFWYETTHQPEGFTPQQLAQLQSMTMAGVLCENSDLKELQENAFFFVSTDNRVKQCKDHPKLDFSAWRND